MKPSVSPRDVNYAVGVHVPMRSVDGIPVKDASLGTELQGLEDREVEVVERGDATGSRVEDISKGGISPVFQPH